MSETTPNEDDAQSPEAASEATTETTPAAALAPAPAADTVPEAPAPASPTPTPPAPSADATQPDAPAVTAPVAATTTAPAPSRERRTVGVPVWLLVVLAAIVGAAAMFGIGYAVGHDDDDGMAISAVPGDQQIPSVPNRPNLPNFPREDDDQTPPDTPSQQVSGAFLGIATEETDDGLEIVQVVPNSAAADAGLRVGDLIVEFDDDEVTTSAALREAVADHDPGDDVEIVYTRGGTRQTVSVELGSRNTSNSN